MTSWFKNFKILFPPKKITAILTYHAVYGVDNNPLIADRIHNIPPDLLYAQLKLLKKHFSILPLDELVEEIKKNYAKKGLAAVTFDDGYVSVIDNAVPILETLNIPATFFLSTKLIESQAFWRDKVRYLINESLVETFLAFAIEKEPAFSKIDLTRFYSETKDPERINSRKVEVLIDSFLKAKGVDLDSLALHIYCSANDLAGKKAGGLTFGNHSHSHYVLSSMTKEEQYRDMALSEKILLEMGLPNCNVFSIPFGTPRDFNDDTLDILKDLGYGGYVLSTGKGACDAFDGTGMLMDHRGLVALNRFMPSESTLFLHE